jgi:hypothetical protein
MKHHFRVSYENINTPLYRSNEKGVLAPTLLHSASRIGCNYRIVRVTL